jgi:cyclophilin family peptidyl-prolyl cis-trans isomerase
MMRRRLIVALIFSLVPAIAFGGDASQPSAVKKDIAKRGPKAEAFYRINGELNALLAELAQLQIRARTADEEKQAEIQQQWKELVAKGEKIEPRLIKAAEEAYAEAPNADPEITRLLVRQLNEMVARDDFEPAAAIGNMLMKNHCSEKTVAMMAGVAAFAVSDYNNALAYMKVAIERKEPLSLGKERQYLDQLDELFLNRPDVFKESWKNEQTRRQHEAEFSNLPRVLLKTTKGDITLELFEDQAPNTVANFISLVEKGFYKDLAFHRVVAGFVAQGGDPRGNGTGGPGYSIACECYRPDHREHFRGSLSMAHAGRDTGGSQFFITFVPAVSLNGVHTVFGRVIDGMDVLAKLQRRDPDDKEAPRPDRILDAKVLRKRSHPYKPVKMPE